MRDLIDDAEAVAEVCRIGRAIEEGMAEWEREVRRWRPAAGGGHDPELRAMWQAELARGQLPDLLSRDIPPDGGNPEGAKKTCQK